MAPQTKTPNTKARLHRPLPSPALSHHRHVLLLPLIFFHLDRQASYLTTPRCRKVKKHMPNSQWDTRHHYRLNLLSRFVRRYYKLARMLSNLTFMRCFHLNPQRHRLVDVHVGHTLTLSPIPPRLPTCFLDIRNPPLTQAMLHRKRLWTGTIAKFINLPANSFSYTLCICASHDALYEMRPFCNKRRSTPFS